MWMLALLHCKQHDFLSFSSPSPFWQLLRFAAPCPIVFLLNTNKIVLQLQKRKKKGSLLFLAQKHLPEAVSSLHLPWDLFSCLCLVILISVAHGLHTKLYRVRMHLESLLPNQGSGSWPQASPAPGYGVLQYTPAITESNRRGSLPFTFPGICNKTTPCMNQTLTNIRYSGVMKQTKHVC